MAQDIPINPTTTLKVTGSAEIFSMIWEFNLVVWKKVPVDATETRKPGAETNTTFNVNHVESPILHALVVDLDRYLREYRVASPAGKTRA